MVIKFTPDPEADNVPTIDESPPVQPVAVSVWVEPDWKVAVFGAVVILKLQKVLPVPEEKVILAVPEPP